MQYPKAAKFVLALFIACSLSHASFAQAPALPLLVPPAAAPPPAASAVPAPPRDALGRGTPKGMIQGFLKAVGSENYEQASSYLDLRGLSPSRQKSRGPDLARDLQTLFDQSGWVATSSTLSDSPDGKQDDGLPPKIDLVGTIRIGKESVNILAERHDDPDNGPIWQFSKDTVADIPTLLEEVATGPLDRLLPPILIDNKWYGVPVGHWLAILSIAALALFPAWLLTFGVIRFIRLVWPASRSGHAHHVLGAFVLPIRIYIALGIFVVAVRAVGISIVARQDFILIAEIAGWLSLLWLLWRIIDIIAETVQERMTREKKRHALSSVIFFRRSSRLILAGMAIALAMSQMGLDVTAWFAALGVGGLALAFGAKTTLENFVVGLTLIVDKPLRIGDFCTIGNITGTVEDIGMRSTRLTTLDRTTVTIPNGTLTSLTIENYALRTRYWFHPTLGLRYETTPDQLRQLLEKLREFLGNHPLVEREPFHVRFLELAKDSLNVGVFAYIPAKDYEDFLKIQEDLLLGIMEVVNESGVGFAFPSQTIYFARDGSAKKTGSAP